MLVCVCGGEHLIKDTRNDMRFFRMNDSGVLEVTESLCAVPNRVVVYLDDVTPFMPPEATSGLGATYWK